MGKPKQNIDDYTVGNFYPEALLVFMTVDNKGYPIRNLSNAFTTIPDISDIVDISMALGATGKMGQFSVKINNANNKYFIPDNVEAEITNLKEGKSIVFSISEEGATKSPEIRKIEPEDTWESVQDFLNNIVFQRVYEPEGSDSEQTYILYEDGIDPGTKKSILKYKIIDKNPSKVEGTLPQVQKGEKPPPQKGTLQVEEEKAVLELTPKEKRIAELVAMAQKRRDERLPLEDVVLTDIERTKIMDTAKTQSAFFEEYGGQLENGRCVFEPMQLMVCLLSRRFRDENDPNDMIVAFTGYVDSVSEEYDGKTSMLRIQGSDVSKLLHITQANVNPSLFEAALPSAGQYRIWQNIFSGQQGWQIIKALVVGGKDEEGNPVHGAGNFVYNAKVDPSSSTREHIVPSQVVLTGLKLNPGEISDAGASDKLDQIFFKSGQVHIQILPFEVSPKGLRDLSVYKKIFGASFQNWQNEYRSHLEIGNEVAALSNYEFYADQFGDVWYHQPRFHNYHVLTNTDNPEIYVLRDEDILTYQFTESDKGVVTSLYVAGQPNYVETSPQILKMTAFYEDISFLRKYGRRMASISHPYITNSEDCFYFAKSWMLRVNAGRFVGSVTIIGRPELRMHMPIYIPMRNMIYYITGISHKFTYGSSFVTTLNLKYGHKPWEILPEILDYGIPGKGSSEKTDKSSGDVQSTSNVANEASKADEMDERPINKAIMYDLWRSYYGVPADEVERVRRIKGNI